MAFKLTPLVAAFIIIIGYTHCVEKVDGFCSLEKMKEFAVEACEHLFPNDEPPSSRYKREYHHRSKSNKFEFEDKTHMLAVRRSTFPNGGYLKVAQTHIKHLSKLNIFPMYKRYFNKKHHDGDRHKREAYNSGILLPYCCYKDCGNDFFCR